MITLTLDQIAKLDFKYSVHFGESFLNPYADDGAEIYHSYLTGWCLATSGKLSIEFNWAANDKIDPKDAFDFSIEIDSYFRPTGFRAVDDDGDGINFGRSELNQIFSGKSWIQDVKTLLQNMSNA